MAQIIIAIVNATGENVEMTPQAWLAARQAGTHTFFDIKHTHNKPYQNKANVVDAPLKPAKKCGACGY